MKARCVFLDRDGVINEKAPPGGYIETRQQFRLLPQAAEWIRLFNALDFLVIVVTNQRGIARGAGGRDGAGADPPEDARRAGRARGANRRYFLLPA